MQNASGVLCIDEVHERSRHILFATDPILDTTVHWDVVKTCDQATLDAFLDEIKALGFSPRAIITDGSPLYTDALTERWETVEHQLCIFHVLAEINKDVLKALRAIRDELPQPKKYRRGRPSKRGRPRKKDDRRAFVFEQRYLIVKRRDRFTAEDEANWKRMREIDPRFETLRNFIDDAHALFEKGISQQAARNRHTRLLNNPAYRDFPHLGRAKKRLKHKKFEKMIVFLNYANLDRTNNHVERGNRTFRMLQKTRYRRRRRHTILLALELHLLRRWRKHPRYHNDRKAPQCLRRKPKRMEINKKMSA